MEFQSFDSFEEMMRHVAEQMKLADARVQPWQAAIGVGDCFSHASGYGFDIYGQVHDRYSAVQRQLEHCRICKCYSVACVEGELGDVHVSVIEKLLSAESFEAARAAGWQP